MICFGIQKVFYFLVTDIDRDRPKFPGLMGSTGGTNAMMTSLGGSINPSSLFMPPSAGLGSHLPHHGSHFSATNHLHHNSGGSSSGGSRSAESSPTTASGKKDIDGY